MTKTKLVSLAVLLLSASFCFAQSVATGDLQATVKDPGGKLVTNAKVTASNPAKGLERTGAQSGQGEYRVLALPPGTYKVTVEAPGFAKLEVENVIITVGEDAELPVTLSVAGTHEVVNVSSMAELVETTRSSTTDTVEQRSIDDLPINGRNYIDFTLTDSQVVRDNAPNIGAAPTSGLNMSGQRARSNLVNVDGADATDNSTNGVRSTVSQEDVQEFQIITNGYAPEYGRAAGGVVNIITRSGSNDFHGDVFGYLRNRNFQATNPFSTVPNPAYTRVQAGVAFGGPIKKDKTYYFFSYEITRRHETGFATLGQGGLPYWGLQNFDATNIFAPGLVPPGTFNIQVTPQQAQFLSTPGLPGPLLQEYAFLAGASSGIALNGSYPASFALLAKLGAIPVPSNGTNPLTQFASSCNPGNLMCNGLPASFLTLNSQVGNFPVFEGTSLYAFRLDHNITERNRLMLRSNVSPSTVTGIEVNGEDQTFGQNAYSRTSEQTYRDAAGEAQDTWTIGNNRVNEFRFQYARRGLLYNYSSAPGGSDVAVNIPGFGYFGREPYSYIQRTEDRYQFADNFSWSIGRHDTKFGGDFDYIPVTATFTVNYGGVYSFGALTSSQVLPSAIFSSLPSAVQQLVPGVNAVQAYGLGAPQTLVQGIGNPHDSFSNKPLGMFWQDSWRVRPNFTFNYGVRYDIEFPPQLAPPDPLALAAYNSLGLQKGIQTDTHNVQPRLGLAWDPKGNGKDVIRASYGIFYDHPLLGLYFLGDASDGSKSGQLLFAGGTPCGPGIAPGPSSLNATNIFQGILTSSTCLPTIPGYQASGQRFNPAPFTSASAANPQFPGLFVNQNYLNPATFFPLAFQPFGYPQAKNFVYARSQQANLTLEHDFGHDLALSLAYNFNGGRHLNRPINANTVRGDLLVKNWQSAIAAGAASPTDNPLSVGTGAVPCGSGPGGPWVSAPLVNFFRPSGLNPAIAGALLTTPAAPCVAEAQQILAAEGLSTACNPATLAGCVPFSDMVANYSNGSSDYNGFSANLRKRFSAHYEFLASYTYSHAIDDSTDLQAPLSPQDSYYPSLERSNSLFDQRHRFVLSGVYQSGRLGGNSFSSKLLSNWTVAPIVDIASGRPFNILTGDADNFQFSPDTGRPNVVPSGTAPTPCGPAVASKFSPTGFFQEPCYAVFAAGGTPTLLSLDGTLGRNAGFQPWTVFNDLRVARRLYFGERVNLDLMVDMFNLANRFNV
ncbi:MAG TPA: carboxypeptidase regulatory-like domain-containing protein, partial [Terriglobales bacterium]|nr:carboxypeptidase regulatory-like domain-containing protein [Terriglobales bacterium]